MGKILLNRLWPNIDPLAISVPAKTGDQSSKPGGLTPEELRASTSPTICSKKPVASVLLSCDQSRPLLFPADAAPQHTALISKRFRALAPAHGAVTQPSATCFDVCRR